MFFSRNCDVQNDVEPEDSILKMLGENAGQNTAVVRVECRLCSLLQNLLLRKREKVLEAVGTVPFSGLLQ